ncbi:46436_t:CDS:2 [Gigaspora margarita]|uniref:46436_t:CDS:1 n=1 Tax=Gigaspora margarita TaxID=4874 RepID=A0ABN7VPS3_GIGMA|nr:46436_t:CDS:2 [Gigaspora margarita]
MLQIDQLTAENVNLKEELEILTAENFSLGEELTSTKVKLNEYDYFYEQAIKVLNHKNALIQECMKLREALNHKNALIQKYANNFKKQDNKIISLEQTRRYLQAKLDDKNLVTSNNLDKKTLDRVYKIGL